MPMSMNTGDPGIGTPSDSAALGDGSIIGILKQHRVLLTAMLAVLGAGLPAALISGRLATNTVAATATAAAPTYSEGDDVKLSVDLAGTLRAGGGGGGGNPTGGRLDSIRRLDTLRYLAAGRLDSVRRLDSLFGIRPNMTHIGRTALDSLFATNAIVAGLNDEPASSANALGVRIVPEAFAGIYSYTLPDVAGVAAATNYLCVLNPAASGDTIVLLGAVVNAYSNTVATANNSMALFRATTCSAGTNQAATAINEFQTSFADKTAEVRTAAPTSASAAVIHAWPPCHAITAVGSVSCTGVWWNPPRRLLLLAGEAVLFRSAVAGDIDQRYSITIIWGERN